MYVLTGVFLPLPCASAQIRGSAGNKHRSCTLTSPGCFSMELPGKWTSELKLQGEQFNRGEAGRRARTGVIPGFRKILYKCPGPRVSKIQGTRSDLSRQDHGGKEEG